MNGFLDINPEVIMADILIRGVPEDDVRQIDKKAARLGISRTEYLRRRIAEDARRKTLDAPLTPQDFVKFTDLADDDLMAAAWE